ncbi:hypothetical protein NHX12_032987, partial [Muraenolepis orangiensis]
QEEVGITHLAQQEIKTENARPKCRPRRLPLARQEASDQAMLTLLQAGTIEPSDSPWAASVVMVLKKLGHLQAGVRQKINYDVWVRGISSPAISTPHDPSPWGEGSPTFPCTFPRFPTRLGGPAGLPGTGGRRR